MKGWRRYISTLYVIEKNITSKKIIKHYSRCVETLLECIIKLKSKTPIIRKALVTGYFQSTDKDGKGHLDKHAEVLCGQTLRRALAPTILSLSPSDSVPCVAASLYFHSTSQMFLISPSSVSF